MARTGPLLGVKVVEISTTIAGPACGRLMADFGADVIKVEPLWGDPIREVGPFIDGVSPLSTEILRGKKSIAIDIKKPDGLAIVRKLIKEADVVVENNRPGVMEKLGLSYDSLKAINKRIIMVRISGYGQDGPYSARPGYGAICEGLSGVRYMTGDPDRPPSRVALSTTDYLASMYAAFGVVAALFWREQSGLGQMIDVALYEAAFSQMAAVIGAYDKLGVIAKRQGPNLPGMAPNSLYLTRDGAYILIAANSNPTFSRLAQALGKPELLEDTRFNTVKNRGLDENARTLDKIINEWTMSRDSEDVENALLTHAVPMSRVYTIADIFKDEHYRARNMLIDVPHPVLGSIKQHGIVPKFSLTPGSVAHAGPMLGADTDEVLSGLGFSRRDIERLHEERVIGGGSDGASARVGSLGAQ